MTVSKHHRKRPGARRDESARHRPEGSRGRCDRLLTDMCRALSRELIKMFRRLEYPTLALPPEQRHKLAAFLLPKKCSYALDFLLRRHRGPHFRNRYPSLSFV